MGSHSVAQADLKLLGSSSPPTLASQSAEVIDVSHHTQPFFLFRDTVCSVAQAGMQWRDLGSLQSYPPGTQAILIFQPPT